MSVEMIHDNERHINWLSSPNFYCSIWATLTGENKIEREFKRSIAMNETATYKLRSTSNAAHLEEKPQFNSFPHSGDMNNMNTLILSTFWAVVEKKTSKTHALEPILTQLSPPTDNEIHSAICCAPANIFLSLFLQIVSQMEICLCVCVLSWFS